MPRGEGRRAVAEVAADNDGWHWLQADYAGDGRLIVAGWGLAERYEAGPAPSYALLRILEHLWDVKTEYPSTDRSIGP